jgi:hypothetical protein
MQMLAKKHKRDVGEVHQLFYKVNCDRLALVELLEGGSHTACTWEVLEDLALRDCDSEAYKHVLEKKGYSEVAERKYFLGIQ